MQWHILRTTVHNGVYIIQNRTLKHATGSVSFINNIKARVKLKKKQL